MADERELCSNPNCNARINLDGLSPIERVEVKVSGLCRRCQNDSVSPGDLRSQ